MRALLIFPAALIVAPALAQDVPPPPTVFRDGAWQVGDCMQQNTATGHLVSTGTPCGAGGGPTGAAGGDLGSTYPNPTVLGGTHLTGTGAGFTSGTTNALGTTGAAVNVNSAAPPTVGQSLTATGATTATWQTIVASAASFTPGTTTIIGSTAPCFLRNSTSTASDCAATVSASVVSGAFPSLNAPTGGTFDGTFTGNPTLTSINTTAGVKQNGSTVLNMATAVGNPGLFIGQGAGAVFPYGTTGQWSLGIGFNALNALTAGNEDTAIGTIAGQYVTTGQMLTCIGVRTCGTFTTESNVVSVGVDTTRNAEGLNQDVDIGNGTQRNGSSQYVTAVGHAAAQGNASSVTVGGTVTTNDVLSLAFSTSTTGLVTGLPATASYTVKGGDTLTTIANGLIAAIVALPVSGQGVNFGASLSLIGGGPLTIILDFPGTATNGWTVTTTPSVTGAATETLTVGGGMTGSLLTAIGTNALNGTGATTGQQLVGVGTDTLPFYTTATQGVAIGDQAGFHTTTSTGFVYVGSLAGWTDVTGFSNTFIGFQAGYAATASNNTVVGAYPNSTARGCITSGQQNIQIGVNVCVPSPTVNGQIAIGNLIYGLGATGLTNATSDGKIGIGSQVPNAKLTVGESTTYGAHIGALGTAPALTSCGSGSPALDATATDMAGTITEGTSATGCIATFHVAYATAPHCVVSSPGGFAFTSYSTSTAALTLVNGSASGNTYSYVCVQ